MIISVLESCTLFVSNGFNTNRYLKKQMRSESGRKEGAGEEGGNTKSLNQDIQTF